MVQGHEIGSVYQVCQQHARHDQRGYQKQGRDHALLILLLTGMYLKKLHCMDFYQWKFVAHITIIIEVSYTLQDDISELSDYIFKRSYKHL